MAIVSLEKRKMNQRTIAKEIAFSGIGVHSGNNVIMKLKPAEVNTGIVFVRTDISDKNNVIIASYNYVRGTTLCTLLSNDDGICVSTVEHLMAALSACEIDNLIIEIDNQEVPILDGSSIPFVKALQDVEVNVSQVSRKAIRIRESISVKRDHWYVELNPLSENEILGFYIDVDISFQGTCLSNQSFSTMLTPHVFKNEIASARTFGFLKDIEMLRSNGLALGGSLDNAVIVDNDKILNPEGLRYDDEAVRHKVLDVIGDLYMAQMPIIGRFYGSCCGHAANNEILKALFANPNSYEIVEFEKLVFDGVAMISQQKLAR